MASQVARTIADAEERSGRRSAAALLRGSLNGLSLDSSGRILGSSFDPDLALIRESQGPSLDQVVLSVSARRALSEITTEFTYRGRLQSAGAFPRTKLLFHGPPGCGKTLAARSLGTALGLPVLTVRLSSLVGAYLGQTGVNLRSVFRYAESHRCLLLLDEFDAIARNRGRSQDVGELDRVVISLLQELDHTRPEGLVVAATNAPEALDRAIWRRFELKVEFPRPTRRQLEGFARTKLKSVPIALAGVRPPKTLNSFADIENWVRDEKRRAILRTVTSKNAKTR